MLTFFRSRSNPRRIAAERLYAGLLSQSRNPVFYAEWGVPDTVDGRFDMVLLHAFAVMRRLAGAGGEARKVSQALYDVMFVDMDHALREIGVGDLSVGRHVRNMMKAFNGRMAAYETGLCDPSAMRDALRRNVFGTRRDDGGDTSALAAYLTGAVAGIDATPIETIIRDGHILWAAPAGLKKSA